MRWAMLKMSMVTWNRHWNLNNNCILHIFTYDPGANCWYTRHLSEYTHISIMFLMIIFCSSGVLVFSKNRYRIRSSVIARNEGTMNIADAGSCFEAIFAKLKDLQNANFTQHRYGWDGSNWSTTFEFFSMSSLSFESRTERQFCFTAPTSKIWICHF